MNKVPKQSGGGRDISKTRRNILLLLTGAVLAGAVFLLIVGPVVSNLPPEDARVERMYYVIFAPVILAGLALFAYVYLRPVAQLAAALQRGETPPPHVAQRARTLAFTLPARFLYVPVLATAFVAITSDVLGVLLIEGYSFVQHFPNTVLSTIAAAPVSLVISVVSRQILTPVLLVTAELAQDVGPRSEIRQRQFITTLLLTFTASAFLGVLGYTQIVQSAREGLRDKYHLLGESVAQDLAVSLSDDELLFYVEALSAGDEGLAFIVDDQGEIATAMLPADQDLQLDRAALAVQPTPRAANDQARPDWGLVEIPQGEVVLIPLDRPHQDWRLGFAYRVSPLEMPLVQRTLAILLAFVGGMFAIVFVINRYVADDLTRDIQYVTQRLLNLAQGRQVKNVAVLSLDEVGDLIVAFNQLQTKMQRQLQEQASLYAASAALTSSLNIETILTTLIRQMTEVLGVERCAIADWDETTNRLVVWFEHAAQEGRNVDQPGTVYDLDHYAATMAVLQSGQPLNVLLSDESADEAERATLARQNLKSLLMLPLTIKGRSIGLVKLMESDKERRFTPQEIRLAQALAQQAAVALENGRLFQHAQEHARELALLHEVSQRVSSLLDLEVLLDEVVTRVTEVFGYQVASVHLIDEATGTLLLAAQAGMAESSAQRAPRKIGDQGIVPWVAAAGQPLLVPDVSQDERYVEIAEGTRSELAIPLRAGDKIIGVFNLESSQLNAFDEDDVHLMTALANQITAAVQNARLFERTWEQAQALAAMTDNLTREKSKLDAILRNIADGLIVTDPADVVLLVNPAFEDLFDRPAAKLMGRPLAEGVTERELQHLIANALQDPAATFMAEIPLPDGRTLKASSASICEETPPSPGEPRTSLVGVVTVLRDVTHEKEVDRLKTDFISTVSHELRTPLTSVLGFAKLISRTFERDITAKIPPDDRKGQRAVRRVSDNLDIIVKEGERLTRLINDVLDVAKMDAGKIEWHDQSFDLPDLIHQVVQGMQVQSQEKGLSLQAQVVAPERFPPLLAEPDRIRQVVVNLVANAIKFTEQGQVRVAARLLEATEEVHGWRAPQGSAGGVLVDVSDTGPGIAAEDLPRLFQRFQQLGDTLRDKPTGTGLGLVICREIVTHYGGTIWATSVPGSGATFSFTLPLTLTDVEAAPLPVVPPVISEIRRRVAGAVPAGPAAPTAEPALVLIVDDETHIRSLLVQELSAAGYRTLEATNGAEALDLARRHRPAVILLDVLMPDISGFDVTRVLKADQATATIPILILSIIEDQERGLALGADAYLTKPVDVPRLLDTISSLLTREPERPTAMVAGHDRSALETITAILREQDFEVVEAYDPRGAIATAQEVEPDLVILDEMISRLNDAEILKALRFQDPSRAYNIIVLAGEKSPA